MVWLWSSNQREKEKIRIKGNNMFFVVWIWKVPQMENKILLFFFFCPPCVPIFEGFRMLSHRPKNIKVLQQKCSLTTLLSSLQTPMNQASTRSHCIFTVHLCRREPGSATLRRSKLHLVDLAGSDRVSKTGLNGQLLTEAKYINLSLHYLEQVATSETHFIIKITYWTNNVILEIHLM